MTGIRIGSNMASLQAQRRLSEGSEKLASTFERLSSGLRINRASDDAAGLAIASALRVDSRVFTQAIRNLGDGISYLSVAEGAVGELKSILIRSRELSTQSSNGTYSDTQRASLDIELQELGREYNRIIDQVEFNDRHIFSGDSVFTLQAGYGLRGVLSVDLGFGSEDTLSADGTFSSAVSYSGGTQARSLLTGDLNGDGKVDVMSILYGGAVNVLLGNGNGSFSTGTSYNAGSGLLGVTGGDFNNDGKLDIAVTSAGETTQVRVLLGNGNGTFNASTSLYGAPFVWKVSAGDLNGDNADDLVVTGYFEGTTNILLSNGNGTFAARVSLTDGPHPATIDVRDINGDGKLDLLTLSGAGATPGVLSTFFGNGNGTFSARVSYNTYGDSGGPSVIADFNNDGKLDYIARQGNSTFTSVLLGNGNGSFLARMALMADNFFSLSATDVNGDGTLDLIGSNGTDVSVLVGNGNGTFSVNARHTVGGSSQPTQSLALADVNNDGVTDILTVGQLNSSLNVLLANTASSTGSSTLTRFTGLSVATRPDALQGQSSIDAYFLELNTLTGTIGSARSRIDVALGVVTTAAQRFQEAEGRIVDADIAHESAELARRGIIQQAAASVLASANAQPALALQLLQ